MSIALERNSNNRMEGLHEFYLGKKVEEEEEQRQAVVEDSCSSSSIGRNSDLLSGGRSFDEEGEGSEDTEVQSSYKGPLDTMDALEDVLPIRRGISKFYHGKSKSFTSLACVSSSSMKEIAKPGNAYSRKRKNLLACSVMWDKNRNLSMRSNGGGISKRATIKSSRSTLALAVAMSSSESLNTSEDSNSNSNSTCPSPPHCILPPLHPQTKPYFNNSISPSSPPLRRNLSSWRSFSLTDLQHAGAASPTTSTISSLIGNGDNKYFNHY